MKNRLIFIFTFIAILSSISFWNAKKSHYLNRDLLLNNIEALANPESPDYVCYGSGSVDCPITKTKVSAVLKLYSAGLDF